MSDSANLRGIAGRCPLELTAGEPGMQEVRDRLRSRYARL